MIVFDPVAVRITADATRTLEAIERILETTTDPAELGGAIREVLAAARPLPVVRDPAVDAPVTYPAPVPPLRPRRSPACQWRTVRVGRAGGAAYRVDRCEVCAAIRRVPIDEDLAAVARAFDLPPDLIFPTPPSNPDTGGTAMRRCLLTGRTLDDDPALGSEPPAEVEVAVMLPDSRRTTITGLADPLAARDVARRLSDGRGFDPRELRRAAYRAHALLSELTRGDLIVTGNGRDRAREVLADLTGALADEEIPDEVLADLERSAPTSTPVR